jgi:hypothetical protein
MEFLWQALMLNKQYVNTEWAGGRNLLLCREKCSTFAGETHTLRSKRQKTIVVHLVNPGLYK